MFRVVKILERRPGLLAAWNSIVWKETHAISVNTKEGAQSPERPENT